MIGEAFSAVRVSKSQLKRMRDEWLETMEIEG